MRVCSLSLLLILVVVKSGDDEEALHLDAKFKPIHEREGWSRTFIAALNPIITHPPSPTQDPPAQFAQSTTVSPVDTSIQPQVATTDDKELSPCDEPSKPINERESWVPTILASCANELKPPRTPPQTETPPNSPQEIENDETRQLTTNTDETVPLRAQAKDLPARQLSGRVRKRRGIRIKMPCAVM